MTDLLDRLDEAEKLGFRLCGDAARELRKTQETISDLKKRHENSRADKLAAAYATLVDQLRSIRDLVHDLDYFDSVDVDIDPVATAIRIRGKLDAIPLDPEKTGAAIVAAAARAESLDREAKELAVKLANAGGLGVKCLLDLPIVIDRLEWRTGPDPISVTAILRGSGRGAMYLIELAKAFEL